MKRFASLSLFAVAAALLAACGGGGGDPVAASGCNGTPDKAVVYSGAGDYPELAAVSNACFMSVNGSASDVAAAVQSMRDKTGAQRVYLIGAGPGADSAMQFMAANPGRADGVSMWYGSWSLTDALTRSIIALHMNGSGCEAAQAALDARFYPSVCKGASGQFGDAERAEALAQVGLK